MVSESEKKLKLVVEQVSVTAIWDLQLSAYKTINYSACVELAKTGNYHKIVDWACIASVVHGECINWIRSNRDAKSIQSAAAVKLSKVIEAKLRAIPIKYDIVLPLPEGNFESPATINNNIQIIKLDDEALKKYDKQPSSLASSDVSEMLLALEIGITHTSFYNGQNVMIIKDRGFVDTLSNEHLLQYDPLYFVKMYVAASIIWGSLELNNRTNPPGLSLPSYRYYFFETDNGYYARSATHSGEDERVMYNYAFQNDSQNFKDTNELFQKLITKHRNPAIAKLQNSIQKSLYWFFEAQKTSYSHLRVVYLCTALDAFFNQYDSDLQKKQIIALEASETVGQQELVLEEIHKLQLRRNSIVHGEAAITYTLQSSRKTKDMDSALTTGGEIFLTRFIAKKMDRFVNSLTV